MSGARKQQNPPEHPDSDRSFEHSADEETPFLSHLVELRSRLLRAVAAIVLLEISVLLRQP